GMGSARPHRLEKQPRVLRICGGEAGEEEIVGAAGILEVELLRRTLDVESPVLGYRWPEPEDASDPPDPAPRQPRCRAPGRRGVVLDSQPPSVRVDGDPLPRDERILIAAEGASVNEGHVRSVERVLERDDERGVDELRIEEQAPGGWAVHCGNV